MGERYGGGHDRMVTGTNYALDQYDKDLAEAEAARRASLASNNIPDLTPDDMIEGRWGFREGTPAWDNNRVGPDMEVGMGRIDLSEEETGLLLNAFSAYPSSTRGCVAGSLRLLTRCSAQIQNLVPPAGQPVRCSVPPPNGSVDLRIVQAYLRKLLPTG